MDIQKPIERLQFTSDQDPIIYQTFYLNDVFTDLYLYAGKLAFVNSQFSYAINISFDLLFQIVQDENKQAVGIKFINGDQVFEFKRQFWHRSREWECELLKQVKRKNFHQFFRPVKKIGRGNFASVYLSEDLKFNRLVAIKAFTKQSAYKNDGKAALENQIKILRQLQNEHIVKFYGVYETQNSVYLSMEYIQGISLEKYWKNTKDIGLEQRKKIIKALLTGVKEMTNKGIIHRDLKPDNIIVSKDLQTIKIVDFGLATNVNDEKYIFVRCGTPGYVAPQILKIKDTQAARLNTISDIFSLGAIFYQLIFGILLFPSKDQSEVLALNRQCLIKMPQKTDLKQSQSQLLKQMLELNPLERISPFTSLESIYFSRESSILKNRNIILAPICSCKKK